MDTNITNVDTVQAEPSVTFCLNILAFMLFVIVSTEFVVLGLLPTMAESFSLTLEDVGWFVTCFAFSASVFGPLLTIIISRYNRRNFLMVSALFYATGNLLIVVFQNYDLIIAVRIIQGAMLPAIISMVALEAVSLVSAGRKGRAVAYVNLGITATTILAIPSAVIVADYISWSVNFAILTLLGVVSAGFIRFILPSRMSEINDMSTLVSLSHLWSPNFLTHLLLSTVLFTGMFTGFSYIAPLLTSIAKLDIHILGWLLTGFGCSGLLGNWLSGRWVENDPLAVTVWVAFLLIFAMVMIVPLAANIFSLILVIVLWGGAHMAAFIVNQIRAMQAGQGNDAFALSLNISANNLGIGLGATIGGKVITYHGVGTVSYAGAIIVAGALAIVILMIMKRSY